ncbi:condensation domain-containing protein [Streptomyces sp. M10(2022)]
MHHGTDEDYVVQCAVDLDGPLDVDRFKAAADALLDRHTNLRAGFRHEGLDRPVQVLPGRVSVPWTYTDLTGLAPSDREGVLEKSARREREQGFSLTRPPCCGSRCCALGTTGTGSCLRCTTSCWTAGRCRCSSTTCSSCTGWTTPSRCPGTAVPRPPAVAGRPGPGRGRRGVAHRPGRCARPHPPGARTPPPPRADHRRAVRGGHRRTDGVRPRARRHGRCGRADRVGGAAQSPGGPWGRGVRCHGLGPSRRAGRHRVDGRTVHQHGAAAGADRPGRGAGDLVARVQAERSALLAHEHLGLGEIQRIAGHSELFDTTTVFENYPVDADALAGTAARSSLSLGLPEISNAGHYPVTLTVAPERG